MINWLPVYRLRFYLLSTERTEYFHFNEKCENLVKINWVLRVLINLNFKRPFASLIKKFNTTETPESK